MINMLVSVIVPSYKPGDYLWDCLNSLHAQTIDSKLFEIIIVLNGCSEPYLTHIKNYIDTKLQGYNVQLIQTDIGGVSRARNIAIDCSRGEYICFVDDDDVVTPNYLDSLLSVSSPSCVGCAYSLDFVDDIRKPESNFLSQWYISCKDVAFTQNNYRGFLSPPVVKLIHKNIIGTTRFKTRLLLSEDSVFCMEIVPRIKDMKLTSMDCIYFIRKRMGSVTRKPFSWKKQIVQMFIIQGYYLQAFVQHPCSYQLLYVFSRFGASVYNLIYYFKNRQR